MVILPIFHFLNELLFALFPSLCPTFNNCSQASMPRRVLFDDQTLKKLRYLNVLQHNTGGSLRPSYWGFRDELAGDSFRLQNADPDSTLEEPGSLCPTQHHGGRSCGTGFAAHRAIPPNHPQALVVGSTRRSSEKPMAASTVAKQGHPDMGLDLLADNQSGG
jgi:hypothetical protein